MKKMFYFMIVIALLSFSTSCDNNPANPGNVKTANITINLATNNSGSVNGAVVRLSSNQSSLIYEKTATNSAVTLSNVNYGTYTLTVTHAGYGTYTNSSFSVQSSTVSQSVSLSSMSSTVTINLSSNYYANASQVIGTTTIRLENINGDNSLIYANSITTNSYTFNNVVYGTYRLTLSNSTFETIPEEYLFVNSSTISRGIVLTMIGSLGGLIFYDKGIVSDGWRYLEAATVDQATSVQWGANGYNVAGTGTEIGTGKNNTELIIAKLSELGEIGKAAQLCSGMGAGWFLPSRDELNQMYVKLKSGNNNVGGFASNYYYWSSSQVDIYQYAWLQRFSDGLQDYYLKNSTVSVRAVRAF